MRIFKDVLEMHAEVERDLFEMGIRVQPFSYQDKVVKDDPLFETIELQGYSYTVTNLENINKLPNLTLDWCQAEFQERVSPDYINPGQAYKLREDLWKDFLIDGKFHYTYNERIRVQLFSVIEELKKHPTTRQAVIEVHNNLIDLQNMGGKGRIPCSLSSQLLLRKGKLDIYYMQRSCDFVTHFSNDVWQAIMLLKYIAAMIDVPPGNFFHYLVSLHAYKKDLIDKGIF